MVRQRQRFITKSACGVSFVRQFSDELAAPGQVKNINPHIHLPGDLFDGIAIDTLLSKHPATLIGWWNNSVSHCYVVQAGGDDAEGGLAFKCQTVRLGAP